MIAYVFSKQFYTKPKVTAQVLFINKTITAIFVLYSLLLLKSAANILVRNNTVSNK